MGTLIEAKGLSKSYGSARALDDVSFTVEAGRIVGLIGPNGAGKTTALKALLGLTHYDGYLRVAGLDPYRQRDALMQDVCFIADVAVLPRWIRVHQVVAFVEGVHPRFRAERCREFLARTNIPPKAQVKTLSKGMVTQLHLAIAMAIDAKLLVLDEPTLGLDILARKSFYDALINDYFDETRTLLITTHQVEEVEHLLTDLLFINRGKLVLDTPMDRIGERFVQLITTADHAASARALGPIHEQQALGRHAFIFDSKDPAALAPLGELRTPGVADLFVATMQGGRQ
jgi:ABC-2 type transport system ATP-binding protein